MKIRQGSFDIPQNCFREGFHIHYSRDPVITAFLCFSGGTSCMQVPVLKYTVKWSSCESVTSCEYTHMLNPSLRSNISSLTAVLWEFWLLPKTFFEGHQAFSQGKSKNVLQNTKKSGEWIASNNLHQYADTVLIAKTDYICEGEFPATMCFGLKRKSSNNSS